MFANKDDYHASSVDDDDDVPQGREIRKPQTHIDHTGWLWKKARKPAASAPSPFKDRWFVLSRDRLLYFKSPTAQTAIAEIQLSEATIRVVDKHTDASAQPAFVSATAASQRLAASSGPHVPDTAFSWLFEIDNKQRTYLLRANNAAEYGDWMGRLLAACRPAIEENGEVARLDAVVARLESDWAVREEERIARLSVLRNTLRDLIACEFFIGWEVDRGREESVLCWLDCEGWRGEASESGRRDKGKEIWDNYCKKGAAKEVRIDEVLREDIRSAIDSNRASDGWIERLQHHMHQLLMAVSFPAFLTSSAFYHACMAAVPTNSPPPSPAHHHQFALQKVKTLRMERTQRSMGGGLPTMRARGGREQERMEEEDMVIVLSDDDERGAAAAAAAGSGGGGGMRDEDGGRAFAGEGDVQTIGVDDESDYVSVKSDGSGDATAVSMRSPVHQQSAYQQPPFSPAAAAYQQQQQQQQQRPPMPQSVTSPPQSPHNLPPQPQSPASFASQSQQPQPAQQAQKGGFFKSIFSKTAAAAAGTGGGGGGGGGGRAAVPAPPPSSEQQKSVEDALASFYSSKPLAGNAIVNTGRPVPPQQRQQQQQPPRQQQPQQQQQQQRPQPLSQQQLQPYQQQQQQRPPPPSHYQQQPPHPSQYPPQARPPQQPLPTAANPPSQPASALLIHTDFLTGMGSAAVQSPAVHGMGGMGGGGGMDMFDQLTIQGESSTGSVPAPAPAPVMSTPAVFIPTPLEDDIFGPPSTSSSASSSPPVSAAPSRASSTTSPPASSFSRPAASPTMASNPLDDDIFGPPAASPASAASSRQSTGSGPPSAAARPAASSQSRPSSPPVVAFNALDDDIFGAPTSPPPASASPVPSAYAQPARPPPTASSQPAPPAAYAAGALDDDIFGPPKPTASQPAAQQQSGGLDAFFSAPSASAAVGRGAPQQQQQPMRGVGMGAGMGGGGPAAAGRGGAPANQMYGQPQQQPAGRSSMSSFKPAAAAAPAKPANAFSGLDDDIFGPPTPASRGSSQSASPTGGSPSHAAQQQSGGAPGMGRGGAHAGNGMGLPTSATKRSSDDPFAAVWDAQKK